MNQKSRHQQVSAQQGAVSVVFAVLMLLLISAGVTAALRLSGAGLRDSVTHEAQSAALFLVESGIERAHALQLQAFEQGNFAGSCTALATTGAGPHSLGRGSFTYTAASHQAITCPGSSADGLVGDCCTFSVAADLGGTRRVVQAQIETTDPNGVAGRASTTNYLNLRVLEANTAVMTNVAYRARDSGGSNAVVEQCANLGNDGLADCKEQWNLDSGGTYSVNGMGVFASFPTAPARFKLQTTFTTNTEPAVRQYVLTGGLFPPSNSMVAVKRESTYPVESKGKDATGKASERTIGSGSKTVDVPNDWCMTSPTAASKADTLVVGFSSMPGTASGGGVPIFMDEVTLGDASSPQAGFSRLMQMRGLRDTSIRNGYDYYLYSQMWTLHNPAYTMDDTVTATSDGVTATVTLSALPSTTVSRGTVLSVPNAAAVFPPIPSSARIETNAIRVPAGANMPAVGDAVHGPHVLSGTYITGAGVVQADGSTRFPVRPTVQKSNLALKRVFFRAAVLADSSSTTITLSRPPSTAFVDATLCGGLCALLQHRSSGTPNADINLIGVTAGDEWSWGMTCLSGVRAEGIEIISGPPLRRVAWNEVVR